MKQLTCEMCGGTDLVKQDGVYVCQSCGTKYSVEEAKKMMIEGTVDVSGSTVKIDQEDALANLYQLARRADETGNSEDAAKYYSQIVEKNPSDWEAYFYSGVYGAMQCKVGELGLYASRVSNSIPEALKLIKENVTDVDQRAEALSKVGKKSFMISSFFQRAGVQHLGVVSAETLEAGAMVAKIYCEKAIDMFLDEPCFEKGCLSLLKEYNDTHSFDVPKINDAIKKFEPDYVHQVKPVTTTGGCYVATAVYGSYDCPEVWTLRRYRDFNLAKTWYGRAFVHAYYAISPILVKWFGGTRWFKSLWRGFLDRMVKKLQNGGIEDTPYNDREW